MKSYTTLRNLYASLANNTQNLTLGDQLINDGVRQILAMPISWKFLETSQTFNTVADQSDYVLPVDYGKIVALKVNDGDLDYILTHVKNRDDFNKLTSNDLTSDYATHYYIDNRKVLLYPTPATNNKVVTIYYKKRAKDLANADYVTGTVSVTNGSTTVTGAGTTFTSAMVGRFIRITTDGEWYKIVGFTSTTVITIEQVYAGTTGSSLAYIIGEMSVLPENHDDIPVFYAVSQYWYQNNDLNRGQMYERMFKEKVDMLKQDNTTSSMDIGLTGIDEVVDPRLYPQNIT